MPGVTPPQVRRRTGFRGAGLRDFLSEIHSHTTMPPYWADKEKKI